MRDSQGEAHPRDVLGAVRLYDRQGRDRHEREQQALVAGATPGKRRKSSFQMKP